MAETAAVRLKPGPHRAEAGCPWIFRGELLSHEPWPNGTPVAVEDVTGRFVGYGVYSGTSQIAVRLWSFSRRTPVGPDLVRRRLESALALRGRLALQRDGQRLVNAEADGLPGLIVDRYDSALVVQILSAGLVPFEDVIRETLVERVAPTVIWEQADVAVRDREGLPRVDRVWYGTPAWPVAFREHGVLFEADPTRGQKTGHYLDQADNRWQAAKWAKGRRVADVFSYTGGFGLQAAKAGAARVVAVDQDEAALAEARRLAAANGVATQFETVTANAFDWLRAQDRDQERYGMVVLDPPAFTKSRTAVPGALRGYREINLRAFKILEPGGILVTATCAYHVSAEQFLAVVGAAAHDAHRQARVLAVYGQPPDHPSHPALPESRYLTCAVVAVDE